MICKDSIYSVIIARSLDTVAKVTAVPSTESYIICYVLSSPLVYDVIGDDNVM